MIKLKHLILIKFTFDKSKPDKTPSLRNCLLIDLQVSWAEGRWLDKLRRLPEGEQCPPPWNDAVYVYTPTVPLEEQTIATSIAYLAPTKYKNHMDIIKSSLMFYIFSSTTGIYRLLVIIITDFIFSPPTYFYQFVN